jgi:hypothetical protein
VQPRKEKRVKIENKTDKCCTPRFPLGIDYAKSHSDHVAVAFGTSAPAERAGPRHLACPGTLGRGASLPGPSGTTGPDFVNEEHTNSGANQARSAAERFLFERLEPMPATAGFFHLNGALDFRFGPSRAAEIDLASRELRLAIELDGYYHFQEADDCRRKDLQLQ